MLPQIDMVGVCEATLELLTPSLCLCYLVVSEKINVNDLELILDACGQAGSKKFILSISFTCTSFTGKNGKIQEAKLATAVNGVREKCFPGSSPFQFA